MAKMITVTNGSSEISKDLKDEIIEKIDEGLSLGEQDQIYCRLTLEVIKAVLEHSVI